MNFDLSSEQQLLKDSVDRFVADNYSLEARVKVTDAEPGFSKAHWKSFADLGWLALPFAEADGGFGGGPIETMLLMEAFGKGLVVEPYLASVVLGGGALRRGASKAVKDAILPGVVDGTKQLALGYAEEQARFDLEDVVTTARAEANGFVLNGTKSVVQNAATADYIVVSARTSGGQVDRNGISLFLVDAKAAGVERDNYPTVDGLRASEVKLTNVRVDPDRLIGEVGNGYAILEAVANDAILALSAEAVGAMEVLYKDTVEYTEQRQQFGHPLSEFQVLQHRMVEMFMEYEQCKSLLFRATLESAQGLPTAQRTIHALKHLVGKAGIFIGENAVQLHGGMGMTEELRIGHYFKRLLVIDAQFGNSDHHLQKFAA
ncbi:MAG TPA: acyl-CoA dehydrogenase family protein [Pseudomonadales bacterium]|jgi:alkylation response protein AidB-like acyl-CoA dehydrogenase|nr:acyl-CoA dehydrogenase family protein [Pseudomonadales bacterium]